MQGTVPKSPVASSIARFGPYTLDLRTAELCAGGRTKKIPEQPFQVLHALLEHPGQLVTREELHRRLWSGDTFVDFEHGLNVIVKRLREILGDSSDQPQFIETIPRRGYRFIGPAEPDDSLTTLCPEPGRSKPRIRFWRLAAAALALSAALSPLVYWRVRRAVSAPPSIRSLAILPLQNLRADQEEDYLCDGITDALITQLAQARELRVISRQSVMRYKGTLKTVPQIAREVGVDALLEGAILREGDRIRISLQLIRAVPEEHLWAQMYERDISSIMRLERELGQDVVQQLQLSLPLGRTVLHSPVTMSAEAHEAYLKAWYFLNSRTTEGMRKAIASFQEAIRREPKYGDAHGGLAVAYYLLPIYADSVPGDVVAKVQQEAAAALALDENQPDAYTARGWIEATYQYDWSAAERDLKRAVDLNPADSNARVAFGVLLTFLNRHEEAIAHLQEARRNDPLSAFVGGFLGYVLLYARQYDQAQAELQRALELDPDSHHALAVIALVYRQKGMYRQSVEAIEKSVRIAGSNISTQQGRQAYVYAVAGKHGEARAIAERLGQRSGKQYAPDYYLAASYLALGERERAFQYLDRAYSRRDFMLPFLQSDPIWDGVREDQRFGALLAQLNLPQR